MLKFLSNIQALHLTEVFHLQYFSFPSRVTTPEADFFYKFETQHPPSQYNHPYQDYLIGVYLDIEVIRPVIDIPYRDILLRWQTGKDYYVEFIDGPHAYAGYQEVLYMQCYTDEGPDPYRTSYVREILSGSMTS
jgi:hypothetical protein